MHLPTCHVGRDNHLRIPVVLCIMAISVQYQFKIFHQAIKFSVQDKLTPSVMGEEGDVGVVKTLDFKPKVSHLREFDPGRAHSCEKGFFLAFGPYWLARCQYNVTEWCNMLICDIVHQSASTLKSPSVCTSIKLIKKKLLPQTHAPHERVYRLIFEVIKKLDLVANGWKIANAT